MDKSAQLRCPYTLRPLTELPELSREHIIPDSLGGPNGYSVTACRAANSHFGKTVDAAFMNDPIVAVLRVQHGIESRSGPPAWKVDGETVSGERPVQMTFTDASVEVYHRKPVDVIEDENGKRYRIVAPEGQSQEVLGQVRKNLAKKGFTISEPQVEKEEQQTIHGRMIVDFNVLQAGLMKIAYLASFDFIGDAFLNDPLNPEWQKAIRVTNAEEGKAVRIHGAFFDHVDDATTVLLPALAPHEHGIVILNLNQEGPVVLVRLFGNPLLTAFARISDTNTFGLQEAEGLITIVDATSGKMRQEPWMNHLVRMAQAPQKQAMFSEEVPEPNE